MAEFLRSRVDRSQLREDLCDEMAEFLRSRVDTLPFKYMGLPLGASPKHMSTWKPFILVVIHFWVPTQKMRKYKKKYSEEIKNNRSKKRMLECRRKVKICLGGSKMQKVKI
jgi:hypothetical protein